VKRAHEGVAHRLPRTGACVAGGRHDKQARVVAEHLELRERRGEFTQDRGVGLTPVYVRLRGGVRGGE